MDDLKLIRHALALARFRNFARAAEALHLTQPSLSRSIAALERGLGVPLFDRGKGGVQPTAFGRVLLARGEELLGGAADLRRELRLMAGLEVGTLAVGAGPYPTEISVGLAVTRLLRTHPRLRVEVICADPDEIAKGILAERFDFGIASVEMFESIPRLAVQPLASHDLSLTCRSGHPLASVRQLAPADVLRFPLVAPLIGGEAARVAADDERAGTLDPDTGTFVPAIHVNSLHLARQIARESDALFPGTPGMVAAEVADGRLVRLDFRHPALRVRYGLVRLIDRTPSPAAEAFLAVLRQVEAEVASADSRRTEPAVRERTRATVRR